jgi:tetratricopeptide (TPR) repeat protein
MASAYNSIGIIYAMKSDIKNAMKSFYDALIGYGVRIRADEETSSLPAPDIFFVWINVGDLHSEKNEWQLALRSFQKACTSFRALNDSQKDYLQHVGPQRMMKFAEAKLRKSFVDNETVLLSVLQNIGKAQCMLQKYGKSVETLQEALRIQKVIFMRCEKADANSTRDVARALGNLGEVQMLSEYCVHSSKLYSPPFTNFFNNFQSSQSSLSLRRGFDFFS